MTQPPVQSLIIPKLIVRGNIDQDVLYVSEDKVRLCLRDHIARASHRSAWIGTLGISLTFLTTLCAAEFKDRLGVDKSSWHAAFLWGFVGTAIWTLVKVYQAIRTPSNDTLIEEIVRKFRGQANVDP